MTVIDLPGTGSSPPPPMEYRVRYWPLPGRGEPGQAALEDPTSEDEARGVAETIRHGCTKVIVERRPIAPWERVLNYGA
jgi:hypothetical protein